MSAGNDRSCGFLARVLGTALTCMLVGCGSEREPARGEPGMTWRSIESLPDFSGWWEWQYGEEYRGRDAQGMPTGLPQIMIKAPLKPEIVQSVIVALRDIDAPKRDRKEVFGASTACLPPYFPGTNGGPYFLFEILFSPGRATLTDEVGLVRRVQIGGTLPADPIESNAGTSVGHWEGDTLVVETTGITSSRSIFITPFRIGRDIHVVERFRLKEPDVLEVSVEMTAPEMLTGPFKDTLLYQRRRDHRYTDEGFCVEDDRSIDHKARKEQFDLTPPTDLPPPPG